MQLKSVLRLKLETGTQSGHKDNFKYNEKQIVDRVMKRVNARNPKECFASIIRSALIVFPDWIEDKQSHQTSSNEDVQKYIVVPIQG